MVVLTVTALPKPPLAPLPPKVKLAETVPPLLPALLDEPPLPPPPPTDCAKIAEELSPVALRLPMALT